MRRRDGNPARTAWLVLAGLIVVMLAIAGCGGGSDDTTGGGSGDEALQKVGKGVSLGTEIADTEWTRQ